MTLIFGLLVVQMTLLAILLIPLPHVVRLRIVHAWQFLRGQNNFIVGLVFTLIMMVLQFYDCLIKLQRFSDPGENPTVAGRIPGGLLSEQLASKFYAQRNLYISGAVLYFGMSLHTVLSILEKLVAKEELYRTRVVDADSLEVADLKLQIDQRVLDIAAMKKQLLGVQNAYDALNDSVPRSKDD